MNSELAGLEELLEVGEHALANAWNGEDLFRLGHDVFNLLGMVLDGLGGVAIGTDAERVLPIDFQQVGGFEKDVGDRLVVHAPKINKNATKS